MKKLTEEKLVEMLRSLGFRVTERRLAVLKAVAHTKEPVTVYALFELLRKKYNIDQATIYRNLASFHEAGLLRRLDFNHGHAHYELETGKPSHQLVCSKCETIEKLDGRSVDTILKKMVEKSKKFKKTTSHTVEIYGICKNCA